MSDYIEVEYCGTALRVFGEYEPAEPSLPSRFDAEQVYQGAENITELMRCTYDVRGLPMLERLEREARRKCDAWNEARQDRGRRASDLKLAQLEGAL